MAIQRETRVLAIAAAIALGAAAQPADSQESRTTLSANARRAASVAAQRIHGGDVLGESAIQKPDEAEPAIVATEEGGKIKARLVKNFGPIQARAQMEAPLSKTTSEATFVSLFHVSGDATVGLGLARTWSRESKAAAPGADATPLTTTDFDVDRVFSGLAAKSREARRRELEQFIAETLPMTWTWSLDGEFASKPYQWFGQVPPVPKADGTLPVEKDAKTATSLRLALAVSVDRWLLTSAFARVRKYVEADPIEACVPLEAGPATTCRSAGSAAPKSKDSDVGKLSARYVVSQDFVVEVNAVYDFTTDTFNPHVLTYFIPIESKIEGKPVKKLRGGFDLSYLSNHPEQPDGVQGRLFVGLPIDLPSRPAR